MLEKVLNQDRLEIFRMKVPGGWLVITTYNRYDCAVAQTFVADRHHQWKLEDKK